MARKNSRIENETKQNDEKTEKKQIDNNEKEKKIIKTILKVLLILILIFILIIGTKYLVELKRANGDVKKATVNVLQDVADTIVKEEPIYVLLMGYSTDQGNSLTDTIILIGYNPKYQKAFMLSIPRDTFIGKNLLKASGQDKINALYSNKGANATVNAVEKITGISINYYITINTKALIKTVDILGGVEFDVPINMNYDDKTQNLHIHLNKGLQTLNGEQAEGLLRFRHNNNGTSYDTEYGDNDYGRMHTR